MRKLHRGTDLQKELQTIAGVQLVMVAVLVDGFTLNQLHDKVWCALFGRTSVEQVGYVGVLEAGQYLPFILESSKYEAGIVASAHNLQGYLHAILIVRTEGTVNLTHTSRSKEFDNLVRS